MTVPLATPLGAVPCWPSTVLWRDERASLSPSTVTVAISLYNYGHFLVECLDSVLRQTHADLDLLIVDDASTDDSVAVAQAWLQAHGDRFACTQLIRHVNNQGLASARNTAFHHARGDLVFVMDADNQIYPRALARLLPFVLERGYAAAYTQLEFFGDQTRVGVADVWQPQAFSQGNYVDAMALVSRHAWAQVGGYTHIQGGWEDYDFWCKFVVQGLKAIFIPEVLCRYRVHGASMLHSETVHQQELVKARVQARHPTLFA